MIAACEGNVTSANRAGIRSPIVFMRASPAVLMVIFEGGRFFFCSMLSVHVATVASPARWGNLAPWVAAVVCILAKDAPGQPSSKRVLHRLIGLGRGVAAAGGLT